LFAFAGLWDTWKNPDGQLIRSCTIITTEANELVAPIHNRMPVILPQDARKIWLDSAVHDDNVLLPLLAPYPSDQMTVRPVSRLVNDPRREGAELIA
jgi:putative SOS response-associated peptidase YedK